MTPIAAALPLFMTLRVKGRATSAVLAAATGASEAEIRAIVEDAQRAGAIRPVPGGDGYALSDEGRRALGELVAAEQLDRGALAAAYERFLAVDRELKERITTWQLSSGDAARSAQAMTDLLAAADAAAAFGHELARGIARLGPYASRLDVATRALRDGDTRFVASPRVDALHQVWFELHEDLLVTLGRTRSS